MNLKDNPWCLVIMNRADRRKKQIDYKKMDEYGLDSNSSMDESFYSEREDGEFEEDSAVDFLNMSETEFDEHVKNALEDGDEEKSMQLLAMKERRCEMREEQVKKQEKERKEEDRAKRRRIKEMQERFKKLQKAENSLNRSLATSASANSTPAVSPIKQNTPRVKMP